MTNHDECRLPGCEDTVLAWLDREFCSTNHRREALQRATQITVIDETHTHDDRELTKATAAASPTPQMLVTTTAGLTAPLNLGLALRLRRLITGAVKR